MNREDAPDVPARPPIVLAGLLFLGVLLERELPIGPGLFGDSGGAFVVGVLIAAGGLLLAANAAQRFIEAGTTFHPSRPNAALVTTGLYAYSRNPMYIGQIILYTGLALGMSSRWALLLLPAFIYYLRYYAIGREEAYLKRRFGQAYEDYAAKVPRWI